MPLLPVIRPGSWVVWIDAVLGEPRNQVLPGGGDQASAGEPWVVGYFGVDIARRLESEHLCIGAELGLAGNQSVQRRVENVDAEWRDAVAGLGEAPCWQRGDSWSYSALDR
jgi:hypothetical protein